MASKFNYAIVLLSLFVNLLESARVPLDPLKNEIVAQESRTEKHNRWSAWNKEKTRQFNMLLEADEQQLRETGTYDALQDFTANPGCGLKGMNTTGRPGNVILATLGTSAMLVAKGCPDGAHDAVRTLAEALTGSLVNPIIVSDKSACSSEAEAATRALVSDHLRLKHLYALMATGVYFASGCRHLAAKVLPDLVRYTTQYSEVHMPLRLFSEPVSDDIKIFTAIMEMEQLEKRLQDDGMLPEPHRLRVKRLLVDAGLQSVMRQVEEQRRFRYPSGINVYWRCEKDDVEQIADGVLNAIPVVGLINSVVNLVGDSIHKCGGTKVAVDAASVAGHLFGFIQG